MMTVSEVEDWVQHAVETPDVTGRCKKETRFTFRKMEVSEGVKTTPDETLRVQRLVHSCIEKTGLPKILMTATALLGSRLPREARPVEFCGSMGFMSSLLSELASVSRTKAVEACEDDIRHAFPYGDIDLSVHVDSPDTLPVVQRTVDNVVCELKMELDRAMFDDGYAELREMDIGEDYYSPFDRDEYNQCRANCCQILPVDDETVVRVDTPLLSGVERRMRYSPLYVSRNTSIKAGFSLTRLLLCIAGKDDTRRVMVPLLDISLSVAPKRPCCPTTLFGCNAMAASAKSVCAHLEEMAAGEGDPAKLERRRAQLAVAKRARAIFKAANR